MKWATGILASLMIATSVAATPPTPPRYPPCHACYMAVAHTGDFDLTVYRETDTDAIDEAILLTERIAGDIRYIEDVNVLYIP